MILIKKILLVEESDLIKMQQTRVIVCKLGRFGELRKVIDTDTSKLRDDSNCNVEPQEMGSELKHVNNVTSGTVIPSSINLFSLNHNFEDSTIEGNNLITMLNVL